MVAILLYLLYLGGISVVKKITFFLFNPNFCGYILGDDGEYFNNYIFSF